MKKHGLRVKISPQESIRILNELSKERIVLFMNLFADLFEIFIGLHLMNSIEQVLRTRVNNFTHGVVGMVVSVLRGLLILRKSFKVEFDGDADSSDSEDDYELQED